MVTEMNMVWKKISELENQVKAFGVEMDRIEHKFDEFREACIYRFEKLEGLK